MKSELKLDEPKSAQVIIASEGFQFGIGVFETMRLLPTGIEDFKAHLNRLENSARALSISIPEAFSEAESLKSYLEGKVTKDLQIQNDLDFIYVIKLILFKVGNESLWLMTHRPFPYRKEHYETGFTVRISEAKRCSTSIIQRHKTLNYGENWLEKQKSIENGYQEVLFLNENHHLTETAASNLFFYKDGKWHTPSLSCGLLDGIMRQRVIDYFNLKNERVCEGNYTLEDIKGAQYVFLTNALMGLMPVKAIESDIYEVNFDPEIINPSAIDPARIYME